MDTWYEERENKNYWWKERWKGQDAEDSKEELGQVMWRIGVARVIRNVLEWQKAETYGVLWQPTFFKEHGTHSDSELGNMLKKQYHDIITAKNSEISAWDIPNKM